MLRLSLPILLASSISAPAFAQAELVRAEGVVGGSAEYELTGDAGEPFIFMPSLINGPVPLALLDGVDPRVMDVGWDLPTLWLFGVLAGGSATLNLPVPPNPGLHGLAVYTQFLTAPGVTTLVDDLSNYTAVRLSLPGQSTNTVDDHVAQLDGHTVTTLADGRVLIAGGSDAGVAQDGFHLYDSQTGRFAATTGTMQVARTAPTATLLADGRVLILGGADAAGVISNTGDVWDPVTGLATPIAPMSIQRTQHSATLLADGRVWVAGGVQNFDLSDPLAALSSASAQTEVYDPVTNTWQGGPSLPRPRFGHSASRLPSGRVLLTGGIDITTVIFVDIPGFTNSCVRYDASSNSLLGTADFSGARAYHGQVTLPDGRVLVAGGADGDFIALTFNALASARAYDEGSNTWANTASLVQARAYPNLLVCESRLVAIGGLASVDVATGTGTVAEMIETSDLAATSWSSPSSMLLPRALPTSTVVDGGRRVLTTGTGDNGSGGAQPDFTAELFLP